MSCRSRPIAWSAPCCANPQEWVPGLASKANHHGDALLAEVGFGGEVRLERKVAIEFGEAVRMPSKTVLPIRWSATGPSGLFPALEADLEVAPLGHHTQLAMSARYVPPLGAVGRAIDRAVLFRVAEATLKDFLDRVSEAADPRRGERHHRLRLSGEKPRTAACGATRMASVTKTPPLRVMLVDDHEIVRDGIRAMLDAEDDIVVTAEAGTVREAVDEAARTRPDVVVMDVRLADGSGIEATREIRADHPATRVLMLTSFADDEALFASIMAGASGYVLKQVKSGDLLRAIRAVGAGDSLLDPGVTSAVLERLRRGKHLMKDEKLARLSPQEERILTAVADGKTNKEIGDDLHLAEKTVKNYVSSILSKLEVARRAEAAAYLARHTTMPGTVEE